MNRYIIFGILALATGAALWWRLGRDPLREFSSFPHTFITVRAMGYDDSKVHIWTGSANPPASIVIKGETAWPCHIDPGGQTIPRQDGKPFLFPVQFRGHDEFTPSLPPLGRPLTQAEISGSERYQTDEGRRMLEAFRNQIAR